MQSECVIVLFEKPIQTTPTIVRRFYQSLRSSDCRNRQIMNCAKVELLNGADVLAVYPLLHFLIFEHMIRIRDTIWIRTAYIALKKKKCFAGKTELDPWKHV